METVSFSQHKFHPFMNVVTIDGEQANGLWDEDNEDIKISFNRDHNLYDYFGNLLRDNSWSGEQLNFISAWIALTYMDKTISYRSGWCSKNQSWSEWTIKK